MLTPGGKFPKALSVGPNTVNGPGPDNVPSNHMLIVVSNVI